MQNFIFYDTETTGLNRDFDQILQFAAILTDANLNELDRFEIKCRCLPWVVPAPMALWVTGLSPSQLTNPALPSFYCMMSDIRGKLDAWGAATYLGYNTIRFDEPMLQRAFWQTLHPPYLTVTNGNARMDVLPLVQAASHLDKSVLSFPLTAKGLAGFKLDQLAPLNGFAHEHAHDALGDVEATIYMARLLRTRVPKLWEHATRTAPKRMSAEILKFNEPVLVAEYLMSGLSLWWGQRLDHKDRKGTNAIVARLDLDWNESLGSKDSTLAKILIGSPKPLRSIAMNKAPLIYSEAQALEVWSMELSDNERSSAECLRQETNFRSRLIETLEAHSESWPKAEHLEQKMFLGFPSRTDQALMERFHKLDWSGRARLVTKFEDIWFRQLAQRLVFEAAPELMSPEDLKRLLASVTERLAGDHGDKNLWRTIAMAVEELKEVRSEGALYVADQISDWLRVLAARVPE